MAFSKEFTRFTLDRLAQNKWNTFSLLHSYLTKPTISSPIIIKEEGDLFLREYKSFSQIPVTIRKQFFEFCYPLDLPDRDKEIAYDRQYLSNTSVFIAFVKKTIVGCVMFIPKKKECKLPIECSYVVSDNQEKPIFFDTYKDSGTYNLAEIYRLRRASDLPRRQISLLVNMLFKCIWNKVVQTKTKYMYLTCQSDSVQITNLYMKKLPFDNPNIQITYDGKKCWSVLRDNCLYHDKKLATLSRPQFDLQTYFRKNVRKKTLYHPEVIKVLPTITYIVLLWVYYITQVLVINLKSQLRKGIGKFSFSSIFKKQCIEIIKGIYEKECFYLKNATSFLIHY